MAIVVVIAWLTLPPLPQKNLKQSAVILDEAKTKAIPQLLPTIEKPMTKPSIINKITTNDSATLVANVYAAELSFPPYSQPLKENDFDRLNPNFFNPQSIPVDDNGTQISATLTKYRYTYPEPISVTLTGENITSAQLRLTDVTTNATLLTTNLEQQDNHWYISIEGDRDFPTQLLAVVLAEVDGKNIPIALSLKYVDSIATLESFEPAYHKGSDMVIKANMTTREQGLYRVRANLFDADDQPIAHLVSKEKLTEGVTSIELKAHHLVLKNRNGPFYLATFTVELMSPAPGKPKRFGDSVIKKYVIDDFTVSSLSDEPYQPSLQEQQRLQLLQKIASGN